jgi:hypothetical protein
MNPSDRLDLKKLMKAGEHDYVDNTDGIRRLKHSDLIAADMKKMEELKKSHASMRASSPDDFASLCQNKCSFLFNAYTDIYNRLFKDQLDVNLMLEALRTLKQVETGKINQQEGSIHMGKLFYKVFVSNAIKHEDAANIPVSTTTSASSEKEEENKITWREYKKSVLKQSVSNEESIDGTTQKKKKKGQKKK